MLENRPHNPNARANLVVELWLTINIYVIVSLIA